MFKSKVMESEKYLQTGNGFKEFGDIIAEMVKPGVSKYLVEEEGPGTDKVVPLQCITPNPWTALAVLGIDCEDIIARYECPYTEYTHFAIVPSALLINGTIDPYKGLKRNPEYVLDWEWHKQMIPEKERFGLFPIQKLLIGSGYTCGAAFNDGIGRINQRRVMLDNGDALWCHFWMWYNK
jgi:hypothetical protein